MTSDRVAVVGGGIGGLAAAAGLVRAGWQVTVFEQAPRFDPVGAGLLVAPNAVHALGWLGLDDELARCGWANGAMELRAADGRWLVRTAVEHFRKRFGASTLALHRAELHRLLREAAAGAALHTGHRVASVDPHTGTVAFAGPDGPGRLRADLVVGADGLHSRIRAQVFPEHPGPAYAGYLAWRGLVPPGRLAPHQIPTGMSESWGRGRRFGMAPLAGGHVYWYATESAPDGSHDADTVADLRARYAGWHEPVPALLAATSQGNLLRHGVRHLRTPLPAFVRGRVALLGDAAHAMTPDTGQGACQAIEDAVTLAAALSANPSTPSALAGYDAARRPRTQRLVRASARLGRVAQWRNPVAVTTRNASARLVPARIYLNAASLALNWEPPRPPGEGRGTRPRPAGRPPATY